MIGLVVLFGTFAVLTAIGVPIAFGLGLASLLTILVLDLHPGLLTELMFEGLNSYTLMAAPFFLLVGQLMNSSQITDRLMALCEAMLGHIRGGLALVNCVVSMLFAGMSGTATADVAASGSIMMPAMVKRGYDVNFAIALTATTATVGVIIPPSVTMIIYGSAGSVSIGGLFIAGVIPGILLTLTFMAYSYYYSVRAGMLPGPRATLKETGRSFRGAFIPLWIPFILVGGVVSGQFTATESGVVGVVLALFLGLLVYRTQRFRELPAVLKEAALTFSLPLFAVATAMTFGWLIAYLEAPLIIADMLGPIAENPVAIVILLVLVFVVLGTFLDAIAAIIIMMPIVEQLVETSGANPIHTGLVIIMTLAMGHLTPPFGLALFLASAIMKQPLVRVLPTLIPFYFLYVAIVLIIALFPGIALLLPRYFLGPMAG